MSLASLANCIRCEKAFNDELGRGVCAACRGQIAFGKALPGKLYEAPSPVMKASPLVHSTEHVLRCDHYAQLGRAHEPTMQRANGSFM